MDIKYKNEFEFLDLGGLDDRTKGEINIALSSGAATEVLQLPWDTGETDYYEADDAVSIEQDENQTWQNYDPEQSQLSYVETEIEGPSVGVISTIPSAHVYSHPPPQIMTTVYGGMVAIAQPNMYEIGPEMNMGPYIQGGGVGVGGGEYQQPQIYLQTQEMHEVTMNRDNNHRRRGYRGGRGNKRETNNRYNIDANNDISGLYHPGQGQQQYHHHRIPRNLYQQNYYHHQTAAQDHQQNPAQKQRQQSYHPVNNAAYPQPIPRPVYTQGYSGVQNNQYHARYPQSISQNLRPQRHEIPKHNIKRNNESSPRPQAINYGPPPLSIQRKTTTTTTTTTESSLNNNSSQQTNIDCVTTVILNNNSKIEHSVVKNNNISNNVEGVIGESSNSEDCNAATAAGAAITTTKYSTTTTSNTSNSNINSNKIINDSDNSNSNISNSNNKVPPVNLTIEHNIVATVNNKTCEIIEKSDNNSSGGSVVSSAAVCPIVNINSSIQVKQKTDNNNVELRKEEKRTVSLIQTETISNPKIEIEIDDNNEIVNNKNDKLEEVEIEQKNNLKEEIIVENKKPDNEIHSISNEPPIVTSTIANTVVTNTNTTIKSVTVESPPGRSWASVLKKSSTENFPSGITNGKPTATITPFRNDLHDNQGDNYSSKLNFSLNEAPGNRQTQGKPRAFSSNVDNTNFSSNIESNASNRSDLTQEEYDPSNKFNDLDPQKTGEFLLKYQMEKQTVSLLPRGLINRNNYCYINSILQALLACPPFYNLLIALPYSKNSSRSNASNNLTTNMIRFVREFSPLSAGARLPRKDRAQKRIDEAINNVQSGIAFEPSYVYTMLKNTSCASVFSVEGRQEDAEEFLSCLLNGISDEMLEMMKLASNENPPIPNESEQVQSNNGEQEEWKIMGPKNKGSITRCTDFGRTPLSDIFRGQLRYRVSRAGEQPTDNVQPFFTLQLDIEKAESVKGALEILVGKDQLEGMTCSKTKREIEAWKQVTLEELPVILILHLKWFDYKLDGCSKILKSVEFPIDLKIDGKIISTNAPKKLSPKQKQYKLFAVTYHDGKEATKGHYVTDAFHVGYGGWVRYDDSSLRGVSENNVLNPIPPRVPYLLYYRRCDTIGNNQLNNDRIR